MVDGSMLSMRSVKARWVMLELVDPLYQSIWHALLNTLYLSPSMHINHHKCSTGSSLQAAQLASDKGNDLVELSCALLCISSQTLGPTTLYGCGDFTSPVHLQ